VAGSVQTPQLLVTTQVLRGRPRGVSSQAPELGERKIGITPFDCPCDNSSLPWKLSTRSGTIHF
jgi:hypothetical protein